MSQFKISFAEKELCYFSEFNTFKSCFPKLNLLHINNEKFCIHIVKKSLEKQILQPNLIYNTIFLQSLQLNFHCLKSCVINLKI